MLSAGRGPGHPQGTAGAPAWALQEALPPGPLPTLRSAPQTCQALSYPRAFAQAVPSPQFTPLIFRGGFLVIPKDGNAL